MEQILMKKILILLITIYSTSSFSSLFDDYISGNLEIADMLVINPDIIDYVGPLTGEAFFNDNDKGFGYEPNLFGGMLDSETEFLSFELHTQNLFQDTGMHLAIAMRGASEVPISILGRGLAIKDTPGCTNGIAIEDFTLNAELGPPDSLKGCRQFIFNNYTTYRIDIHASKNNIAYWIFKQSTLMEIFAGLGPWSLVVTGSCGVSPYATCAGHPDDTNKQNVIIGTAFRSSSFFNYSLSNVYIAKF